MSTLTSLKKLYNKLTGENSKASTNSEAINEITKADIGGGDGAFAVRIVYRSDYDFEANVTLDELCDKLAAGDPVVVYIKNEVPAESRSGYMPDSMQLTTLMLNPRSLDDGVYAHIPFIDALHGGSSYILFQWSKTWDGREVFSLGTY